MAVVWRGSIGTQPITGFPVQAAMVFALVNTFRSRSRVNVLRFVTLGDSLETSLNAGHIMPLLKAWRCPAANVTGGVELSMRPAWDTNVNAPDPGVKVFYSSYETPRETRLAATGLVGPVWEQFTTRNATSVDQRRMIDNSVLSRLTAGNDFSIDPGQALVVTWHYATQPMNNTVFFNFAWEEDQTDAGFTLGGNVTLSGSPVTGALVHVLTDTSIDMPAPGYQQFTTDGSGNWSTTLATGVKAAAFVQHRVGATLYTDEGKPYVEGP